MRISDWSSDVCSSDLLQLDAAALRLDVGLGDAEAEADAGVLGEEGVAFLPERLEHLGEAHLVDADAVVFHHGHRVAVLDGGAARHPAAALGILDGVGDAVDQRLAGQAAVAPGQTGAVVAVPRSEEHTSELPSLIRRPYSV